MGGDGGGSSSSSGGSKKKDKEKQKEEKKGVKEAAEVYCCADDGCNGALGLPSLQWPIFLICLLVPAWFSHFSSSSQFSRYVN